MFDFLRPFKRKKTEITLLLDIGTEAVKALVLQKNGEKIHILSKSLEYFDNYGVFDSRNFERDILKKTILKTFRNLTPGDLKGKTNLSVFLGLPPDILKVRVVSQILKREKPEKIIDEKEEKAIRLEASEQAKKKISQTYSQDSGILPQDLQFINLKILEIKIDGYRISGLRGYNGEKLDFRILTTFLPESYLKEIENICQEVDLKNKEIIHEAEGLTSHFRDNPDGIFLDVGGATTQIFLVKAGRLEAVSEFEAGGKIFSQALSEKLGFKEQDSRIFKEKYSKRELSEESSERIKEILYFSFQTWFENLKSKLKEMRESTLLPSNIILFGGGSKLPEFKEILKAGPWENLLLDPKPNLEIFQPANLKIFEQEIKSFDYAQYIPSLLIYYANA